MRPSTMLPIGKRLASRVYSHQALRVWVNTVINTPLLKLHLWEENADLCYQIQQNLSATSAITQINSLAASVQQSIVSGSNLLTLEEAQSALADILSSMKNIQALTQNLRQELTPSGVLDEFTCFQSKFACESGNFLCRLEQLKYTTIYRGPILWSHLRIQWPEPTSHRHLFSASAR